MIIRPFFVSNLSC